MPLGEKDATKLTDIVSWARKAVSILGGGGFEALMALEEKRLALTRCIEVVGEAAHDVSPAVKAALPGIPWTAMYGMRNRLIHEYGNTNYRVVFHVVNDDLPVVAATIASFLIQQGHVV